MIEAEFLALLRCPETYQALEVADSPLVERFNQEIGSGQLRNRAGRVISEKIHGGLIRADRKFLYPIREGIPIMLIEEAIPLSAGDGSLLPT